MMASGEFDLIKQYFQPQVYREDVLLGVGDDCAVVRVPEGERLAVTTDTLIAGVHFPVDTPPADIAWKAIAVNLSDLAAMGARPAWMTLALTLPERADRWLREFSRSFCETVKHFNVDLIGGDTTQGPLAITLQAMGFVHPEQTMRRDAAVPGDAVYVSGTLGDAAAGLKIRQHQQSVRDIESWLVHRLNRPEPRVELGVQASRFCRCCIDISDGLAADLGHILEASQCGATVNIDKIPLSHQLVEYFEGRDAVDWDMVLAGGDDYELCLVVAPEYEDRLMRVASEIALPLARVGSIEKGSALSFVDDAGARYLPDRSGYEHFMK